MAVQTSTKITVKVISFAMIIIGAIIFIMGVVFIFGVAWLQSDTALVQETETSLGFTAREMAVGMGVFMAGAIVMTVGGLIGMLTGIFGIFSANHPSSAGPAFGAGIVQTLLAIADVILMIVVSPMTPYADQTLPYGDPVQFVTSLVMSGIAIIVGIVFLIMVYKIHKEYVLANQAYQANA